MRIIHGRVLYMGAYYTRVNTVSRVSTRQIKARLWGDICEFCKFTIERRFTDNTIFSETEAHVTIEKSFIPNKSAEINSMRLTKLLAEKKEHLSIISSGNRCNFKTGLQYINFPSAGDRKL